MADGSAFGASFDKEVIARLMDEPEEELGPDPEPEPEPEPIQASQEDIGTATEEPQEEPEETAAPLPTAAEALEEEPPEETPEEQPSEPLILGRYKTPDDLANAYQEVRGLQQRTAEALHDKDTEIEEMKALLKQAAEALQGNQVAAPDPQLVAWAEQQGLDPAYLPVLTQLADQAAQAKVAPMQAQIEAQKAEAERQRVYNEQVASVQAFRSKHSEIEPNSEEDQRHAEIFQALREDPQIQLQWSEETLEIALEATRDPDFYFIIRANPALIDTDEGVEYARRQATLLKATNKAQTQALKKQSKQQREAAARKAHVETGSTAPTGSATEEDPYDIAVAQATAERKSAFF